MKQGPGRVFWVDALIAGVALASVTGLGAAAVYQAYRSAYRELASQAQRRCAQAAAELAQQYAERAQYLRRSGEVLPWPAEDLSLQGVTAAVLRGYPGVIGGYFDSRAGKVLGVPRQSDVRAVVAVLGRIKPAALEAHAAHAEIVASETVELALVVQPAPGSAVLAWAAEPISLTRQVWSRSSLRLLALLGLVSLAGVAVLVSASLRLRRSIRILLESLRRMEEDLNCRVRSLPGELGLIAQAINRMADKREALERQMRQQQQLAALGRVMAGVAHELRNPLNTVRLSLDLVQRRVRRGELSGEELSAAFSELDRLEQLLEHLLDFGRAGPVVRSTHRASFLAQRAISMVSSAAQSRGVAVDLVVEHDFEVEADSVRLGQALVNLLLNAIDVSRPGQAVHLRVRTAGSAGVFEVQDQGPGIPPEAQQHLFEPFYSTKPGGTGLGLALAREIVDQHGGRIHYDTGPRGTIFTVEIPRVGKAYR